MRANPFLLVTQAPLRTTALFIPAQKEATKNRHGCTAVSRLRMVTWYSSGSWNKPETMVVWFRGNIGILVSGIFIYQSPRNPCVAHPFYTCNTSTFKNCCTALVSPAQRKQRKTDRGERPTTVSRRMLTLRREGFDNSCENNHPNNDTDFGSIQPHPFCTNQQEGGALPAVLQYGVLLLYLQVRGLYLYNIIISYKILLSVVPSYILLYVFIDGCP